MVDSLIKFVASSNQAVAGRRHKFAVFNSNLVLKVVRKSVERGYLESYRQSENDVRKIEIHLRQADTGIYTINKVSYINRTGRRQRSIKVGEYEILSKGTGAHLISVSTSNYGSTLLWSDEAIQERKGGILVLSVS